MVSKITATLAILLIIGFINKSFADDYKEKRDKLLKDNKLQCYYGVETNPKKNLTLPSNTTTLKNCNQIPNDRIFLYKTDVKSVDSLGCSISTSVNGNGDTIVNRTCAFIEKKIFKGKKMAEAMLCKDNCVCNWKDGCNSSSSMNFNIVFLILPFAIVYFFAYN